MANKIEDLLESEVPEIVSSEETVVENAEIVAVPTSTEVDLAADIEAIFAGTDLSEEFKEKALRVYEASVVAMATQLAEQAEAALIESFNAELATIEEEANENFTALQESLNTDVENYLAYVSENWLQENNLEATNIVKTQLAESFMTDLGDLLSRHNIELPDDKIDLFADLQEQYAALEATNNKLLEEAVSLKAEKAEAIREGLVHEMTTGLTEIEKDKFSRLSEAVDFDDVDTYQEKLSEIRESYFPVKSVIAEEALDTAELVSLEEEVAPQPKASVSNMPGFRELAKARSVR